MKISLVVIAISGCLIGIIDALRCYDCADKAQAEQATPDDKKVYARCSEEGQADCEEGEVCVSLFFDGDAYIENVFDDDQEMIFTHITRSCGQANPEQTIEQICQAYADFGPTTTFSETTCKRETCETELCNTHGNENLQGPAEEGGEGGEGEGGEGGAGEGGAGEGGAGEGGEGGAGEGGEGGVDDDIQGGDAQYSSGITHTVSALLAATTALCY